MPWAAKAARFLHEFDFKGELWYYIPYIFPLEELFMMKHRIFGLMTALVLMCALSVSAAAFSDVPASHWAAKSTVTVSADS